MNCIAPRSSRVFHLPLVRLVVLICFLMGPALQADTKGKLTGHVLDAKGQPVVGTNIVLLGTSMGATADPDGFYLILNIPPGSYDLRFSAVGYQTRVVKEVRLSAGQTTMQDAVLSEALIAQEEVTTVAERPLVDTRQTSSVAILGREEISVLPVQSLNDVVNLQAGVVDGHFRGGRIGEVQYQVDGVSVNNPYDNSSTIQLDRSVLQEVQVISGTFDAEYGQAMSGVVNAILRSGSDEYYEANAEAYGGSYAPGPSGATDFPYLNAHLRPALQSFTASLSGPAVLPNTSFMLNVRRYLDDGYLFGVRRFVPTDVSDFKDKVFVPTGDNATVAMNDHEEWSGQLKVANRSLKETQISYQLLFNIGSTGAYDLSFRFNPDGRRTQRSRSVVHGFDWTQTLSKDVFTTVSVRQNYFHYTDYAFASVTDPRYFEAGAPRGDANYELGAILQGYSLGRFEQETNSLVVKASVTSQVTPIHLVKAGVEGTLSAISFGAPGTLGTEILDGTHSLVYIVPDSLAQNLRKYHPNAMAAFLQDRVEFRDFNIRAGLRLEYYDANSTVPSDPANPANAIEGVPSSHLIRTTRKIALAPRLGISYPITASGALYFSYGHFYQMPGLGNLYANSDYSVLRNLQANAVSYGVMGNPDIKPEFTTQYEFGFKQQFGEILGVDLSVFSKDIRDLLGVEFIDTYNAARYARFTNVDFGNVTGIKLSVDERISSALSLSLNYTYENAVGNSSDPRETANRAAAGEDPRPRQVPFDWDQRHTLNFLATYEHLHDYTFTLIVRYGSGSPYTPAVGSGFGAQLETNSQQKPAWSTVDLRAEKFLQMGNLTLSLFARVFNVFDSRFANGFVFATTGSAFYSLTPPADATGLIDPSRFAPPRRVEVGLSAHL
jgi:outer membrane receptor protein involved in Fe transport